MKPATSAAVVLTVLLLIPMSANAQATRRSGFSPVHSPPCASSLATRQNQYWFGTGTGGPFTSRLMVHPPPYFPRGDYPFEFALWNPYPITYPPYYGNLYPLGNPLTTPYGYSPYYPSGPAVTRSNLTSMPNVVAPGYVPAYGTGAMGGYPPAYAATYPYSGAGYYPTSSAGTAVPDYTANAAGSTGYTPSASTTASSQPRPSGSSATITVKVPLALTEVIFDGNTVSATGKTRQLNTGELSPGRVYTYSVTANWSETGLPRSVTRQVQVAAGQSVTVDFTRD
jgi:uncharacterized protein (TIGR03000 family)